jgi:hypothetical protein
VAPEDEPQDQQPPRSEGGGGIASKAGSGYWRRLDDQSQWLTPRPARSVARTSAVRLNIDVTWPARARGHTSAAPGIIGVRCLVAAAASGRTATSAAPSLQVRLFLRCRPATAAAVTTPADGMHVDDSLEVMRMLALLPGARSRLPDKLPDDVAQVVDLIARMKKKAA